MHRLMRELVRRGHEVRVLCTRNQGGPFDGVDYIVAGAYVSDHWKWADVVVTQQGATCRVVSTASATGRPVLHLVHNHHWLGGHLDVLRPDVDVVVWNSEALAVLLADDWSGRSAVCRPLVWPAEWAGVTPGDRVTQVNISAVKGGLLALELAQRMPGSLFQFIDGAWGEGIHVRRWPRNVLHRAGAVEDMRKVFSLSRVLIAPTQQVADNQVGDSYGLTAAEAVCAGVPALVTDSPGSREALGDAGVYLAHDDVEAWVDAIVDVAGDGWAAAHERCAAQAQVLGERSRADVDRFEKLMAEVA